jgi:hypothetical protein
MKCVISTCNVYKDALACMCLQIYVWEGRQSTRRPKHCITLMIALKKLPQIKTDPHPPQRRFWSPQGTSDLTKTATNLISTGIDHNRSLRSYLKQKSQARNLIFRPETLYSRVRTHVWLLCFSGRSTFKYLPIYRRRRGVLSKCDALSDHWCGVRSVCVNIK